MQRALRTTALACGLALAAAAPSGARADAHAPGGHDAAMAAADGTPLHGSMPLSLDDAIALGLENNLDVEIARFEPGIAEFQIEEAWGAFDPNFGGEAGYRETDTINTSALILDPGGNIIPIVETDIADGNLGLNGLVPFLGASYGITWNAQRQETTSPLESLSPRYDSGLTFSATLPLARDLIWNQPWTAVRTSKVAHTISNENFRAALMDTVAAIETDYWALVAASENRRVAETSFETARALFDQVETQYEVGVVSRVEVVESEAGVAEREFNLIDARNVYRRAQDQLIDRVLGTRLSASSSLEIAPTDRPEGYVPYDVDVDRAVDRAFVKRPEVTAAAKAVEQQELALRFAKNQRLPRIDLQGVYGVNGLTGQQNPAPSPFGGGTPPARVLGDFGDTGDFYFEDDGGDEYSVRGVVSIPIGNRAGRGAVGRAQLQLRRAETQLSRVRQTVILDVRDGARNLLSSQEGIEAAERRRVAAEEQLRAERIRLEHGESTPFEVLQRERDLVEAESQKIRAYQVYHRSVTQLERAQGSILESRGVRIEEASLPSELR